MLTPSDLPAARPRSSRRSAPFGPAHRAHGALIAPALALLVGFSSAAHAQNDVSLSVSQTVKVGDAPAVTLKVHKDLSSAVLELRAEGPGAPKGQVKVRGGPTRAGGELVLKLPRASADGRVTWSGTLSVTFGDGSAGSMPLAFQTEAAAPPTVTPVEGGLDLKNHSITVTLNRPAKSIDLEVLGDDGKLIANVSQSFDGPPAGTPLKITWVPKTNAQVMRLRLVGHDTLGFYSGQRDLHPWSLDVVHEEIVFDTGEHAIKPSEEPKLQAVLPELKKLQKRYRGVIDVKLYIMGHTDTVGSASANRELSARRAFTIARWFKKHGVSLPAFARGFGEDDLEVQTPDETNEIRNRRVDYRLGVEKPVEGKWQPVR